MSCSASLFPDAITLVPDNSQYHRELRGPDTVRPSNSAPKDERIDVGGQDGAPDSLISARSHIVRIPLGQLAGC